MSKKKVFYFSTSNQEFNSWYEALRKKAEFIAVSTALEKPMKAAQDLGRKPEDLVFRVIHACWYASKYELSNDDFQVTRKQVKDSSEFALEAAKAARTLARIRSHEHLGLNLLSAQLNLKAKGVDLNWQAHDIDNTNLTEISAMYFDSLADALSSGSHKHLKGPWAHRNVVGCLLYPGSIETTNKPTTATMLAFNLAVLFRGFTSSPEEPALRPVGAPMPTGGKPFWETVALLVSVSITTPRLEYGADDARKGVRNLPEGVGIYPWPSE
jgi:hypothetical protein